MSRLTTDHEPAFVALFADLLSNSANLAPSLGSPGSITVRNKTGTDYYYRQYYAPDGRRRDAYIGPVGTPKGEAAMREATSWIAAHRRLAKNARSLAREGFVAVNRDTARILTAIAHHGLFEAGLVLVGTHAYGALLNQLGVRASAIATEDVDLARPRPLHTELDGGMQTLWSDAGLQLVPVPPMRKNNPSTSHKAPGASRLRVDLLAPSRSEQHGVVPVPELRSHAQTLPYLAWLVGQTQRTIVLGPGTAIAAQVPTPERFALHKLLVAQLRRSRDAKAEKDMQQAACLVAALLARDDGALEDAIEAIPKGAASRVRRAATRMAERLHEPQRWLDLIGRM